MAKDPKRESSPGAAPHADTGGLVTLGRALALVGQLGLTVVAGAAICMAGGWALDDWLGTRPAFTLAGAVLGLAGGIVGAYRMLARFLGQDGPSRDDATDERR